MLTEHDYLLVITPCEEVISRVKQLKKSAKDLIGYFPSFNSIAHITINHYYDKKSLFFDDRVPIYRSMVGRIDSFDINICGFDFFKHNDSYTIYAKVDLNPEIKTTFSQFKKVFGSDVPDVPHITIARSITFNQFNKLWEYLKTQQFACSFYTDKIVVLKTPARRFYNQPMEVDTELKLKNAV